jgi:hypothetical protein
VLPHHLIEELNAFDDKDHSHDYAGQIPNLEQMEGALAKLEHIVLHTRMKKLMHDFGERDTDIYIVTYAKSGTTLMQMLLYQLTTDGNMDFGHIYDVSPWCRYAAITKQTMCDVGQRRIIKSHDEYEMLKDVKKGRFIFIMRDFPDVISSFHHHLKAYVNPENDINNLWDRKLEDWFRYNTQWIANPANLSILYLHYEDLVQDKPGTIHRIAQFADIPLTEDITVRATERTTIAYMKAHKEKFGEQPENWKVYDNFIRKGEIGEGKTTLTPQQLEQYKTLSKNYPITGTPLERYF